MALKPEDVFYPREDEQAEISKRESDIDNALRRQTGKYRGGSLSLSQCLFGDDKVIADELVRRYEKAGWSVTYHGASNQMDDSYYTFVPLVSR